MKKIFLFLGVGLLLIIVASMVVGIFFIGPIVKTAIETLGPEITQVSIKLDAVDVSLWTGSAKIKGLIIGNPKGYHSPSAIKLGTASVKLDPFSVFSNKILIHSIHIESPEITYETGLGSSNLSKIMDNVNAVAQKSGPTVSNNPAKKESPDKLDPKIEVDDFLIAHGKIHVGLKVISGNDLALSLPDIHLINLGKESNGITSTELIRTVLAQITKTTVKAVTSSIASSEKVIKGLGKDVHTITNVLDGLFKK